jgi:hypothetical protein
MKVQHIIGGWIVLSDIVRDLSNEVELHCRLSSEGVTLQSRL